MRNRPKINMDMVIVATDSAKVCLLFRIFERVVLNPLYKIPINFSQLVSTLPRLRLIIRWFPSLMIS